ncbi:hypothetical protein BHE74_00022591 [Ensete ventricosum]|nr:hypothetical protein BHE74_00022591 [Ensete ventricosum]
MVALRDYLGKGATTARKQQETARLARGGRSRCGSSNRRLLGYGRGGRRRGAVVALDDRSLLVTAKGSVIDRFKIEETEDDVVLSIEGSVTIEHKDGACHLCCSSTADLVWASTGDDRGRWISIPDRSMEEEQRRLRLWLCRKGTDDAERSVPISFVPVDRGGRCAAMTDG